MNANDFQKATHRTAENQHRMLESNPPSAVPLSMAWNSMGLAGEAGELCDLIKKHVFYGRPLDETKVLLEAGDVLWYLSELLSDCGMSLADAMSANVDKLNKRFPNGFNDADAQAKADEEVTP